MKKTLSFLLLCLFCLAMAAMMASCSKEEIENPREVFKMITYTVYEKNPPFIIKYIHDEREWRTDTCKTNNYSKVVKVRLVDFDFVTQVSNINKSDNDSIYFKAEYQGKKAEQSKGFSNVLMNVWIQPSVIK